MVIEEDKQVLELVKKVEIQKNINQILELIKKKKDNIEQKYSEEELINVGHLAALIQEYNKKISIMISIKESFIKQ